LTQIESLEFCQVKHTQEKGSRWSVADLCKKDLIVNGKGKCLIEKSLEQDRCEENGTFRIISSYPVNNDLSHLTMKVGSTERINAAEKRSELTKKLISKIGEIKSTKGTKIENWIDKCYWQKLPETIEDLRNNNLLLLERIIESYAINIHPIHRNDLYDLVLSKVYNASSCDLKENPMGFKIIFDQFLEWIKTKAKEFSQAIKNDKLEEKLLKAGCDRSLILSARELKYLFRKEKLESNYVKSNELSILETKVLEKLLDLKIKLGSQEVNINGIQFLNLCNDEVSLIADSLGTHDNGITSTLCKGIMYDLTSKCFHRFTKEVS
jgi:hypothetical protein